MSIFPATSKQVPDHSIMDYYGKQAYLGNQFSLVISGFTLTGSSEQSVALIQNPAVAGYPNLTSKALFINLRRISSLSDSVQVKFYINPTVTSIVTPVSPVNVRPASSTASISSCSMSANVSQVGTLIDTLEAPTDYYITEDAYRLIILDPGTAMLVTATPGGNTTLNLNLGWYEL